MFDKTFAIKKILKKPALVFKIGNRSSVPNYRPISILSASVKLFKNTDLCVTFYPI